MSEWQLDFKDASTVPVEQEGKQQHVVEVLDTVDSGTSLLLNAQPRADFTMATTIAAVAATVQEVGLPERVSVDRDPRFVGETHFADAPSPFLRFWLCLGVPVTVLPPRRPDLNSFVERYHRTFAEECIRIERPHDVESATTATERFRQHYNHERPNQALTCGNKPPAVVFATLPARPALPATI